MKIQPLADSGTTKPIKSDVAVMAKPATKSRIKRMLERQFPNVLRNSSSEKVDEPQCVIDTEPSSVCLAKMVQNFMEDTEKQTKCGLSRCNCFNGNGSDCSDDDQDAGDSPFSSGDASEILRSLVPCVSVTERNLLADTSRIVESKTKSLRRNASLTALVVEGLLALGYDASVCRSKWEQSSSYPAGEYEYIDVIVPIDGGTDRLIVDVDFKSEFEIARSTSQYRGVLQSLPSIFVGKPDRLQQIISLVSDAARQSLKKKGLHFPPWRKLEYMRAKWLSPYERTKTNGEAEEEKKIPTADLSVIAVKPTGISTGGFSGGFELRFGSNDAAGNGGGGNQVSVLVTEWTPPVFKPNRKEGKIVAGLASILRDKP